MITLKNNIMNTLKNLRILALLVLLALCSTAQAQTGINYQGLARRTSGAPVAEQNIKLKLSIRDASVSGTVVYTETRSTATNKFGLFNVVIGSTGAASQTGTLAGVNWATGAKFLQVELDPDGGNNFVDMGTTQLQAVPYALYANDVAKIQGNAVSTTAPTTNQILKYNGTAWTPANEGGLSVGAVAASANANAASITTGVLSLAPANATNPGIVTTGAQTFAGNKTFQNNVIVNQLTSGAITYPNTAGTNGQALVTNGAGTASWQTVGGGGGPAYKQSRVEQNSATGTADSEIEVGGMAFRYNTQNHKVEVKKTTSGEYTWQAYITQRIEDGVPQSLPRPEVLYSVASFIGLDNGFWGNTPTTFTGYYNSYAFELTPYYFNNQTTNHSFNITLTLDGWGIATLRVIYY